MCHANQLTFLEDDLKNVRYLRTILKYVLIRILHYLACVFTTWCSSSQIRHHKS